MLIVPVGAAEPLMAGCRTEFKVTEEPAVTVGVLVNSSPARYTNLPVQSYAGSLPVMLFCTVITVQNNITGSDPAYDCTGRFVYLAGELFTKTPTVTAGSSVTLNSVLQPAINGSAAPTGTISILEGATTVASATISGRVTYITVP